MFGVEFGGVQDRTARFLPILAQMQASRRRIVLIPVPPAGSLRAEFGALLVARGRSQLELGDLAENPPTTPS